MKNQIYELTKKVSAYMGIAMLLGTCFLTSHVMAEETTEENYIVTTTSSWSTQTLQNEYADKIENTIEDGSALVISADGETLDELKSDTRVASVEEDIMVQGCGNTEEDGIEWNMDALNLVDENSCSAQKKVKVAIIDSGIDYSEDIDVAERRNFIPGQDNVSVIYEDSTGHGTCIAGIIAAQDNDLGITGVSPNTELYSARVLDSNNSAPVSRIIEAIDWAIEKDVDILNLSFGTKIDSPALHSAIKRAYDSNMLIIAAAGNDQKVEYPAAYTEAVAVGSIGTDGNLSEKSALGEALELVAPGEQILSTGAFDGVMTCGGTSMAAPHVAGVASLLWEKDKNADAELIRMTLNASAKKAENKNPLGYGIVDYGYALEIYDTCKEIYNSNKNSNQTVEEMQEDGTLDTNKETLDVQMYEDVNYVEGLWKKDQHQELVSTTGLTGTDLIILKIGAVANDNYIQGMLANPQWHGFFKHKDTGTEVNYVACYMYLTEVAQALGSGRTRINKPDYMPQTDYNRMNNRFNDIGINSIPWNIILREDMDGDGKYNSYATSNRNKMLIVYGMALHVATDTFSHSAFTLHGKRITHAEIDESDYDPDYNTSKKYAHDSTYCSNRYTCAKNIAATIVSRSQNRTKGTASDYYGIGYINGTSSICFKLKKISKYIKDVNPNYYQSKRGYFDSMDVNSL